MPVCACVKRLLYWKFDEKPFWNRSKVAQVVLLKTSVNMDQSVENSKKQQLSPPKFAAANELIDKDQLIKLFEASAKAQCYNCGCCEKCQMEKESEKESKKVKSLKESSVAALNYLVCFMLFLMMFVCNSTIWLILAYPPKEFES